MALIVIVVYFIIARAVVRRQQTKRAKYIATALFVLVPLGDMIPGLLYFYSLCALEGGQKIYKTVDVDSQYILKPGEPDLSSGRPAVGGELNREKLLERYVNPDISDEDFSRIFHVGKTSRSIQDKKTGEVLGTSTSFSYSGGWLLYLFDGRTITICPTNGYFIHGMLWKNVFHPVNPLPEKGG
jgi:hypothetical protein